MATKSDCSDGGNFDLVVIANRAGNESAESYGFRPETDASVRVLIPGMLPSGISINRGEYQANPRNVFWRIMDASWELC